VWVDADGAVRAYVARSDAWEENANLMKVGALRFDAGLNVTSATLSHRPADGRVVIDDGVTRVELTADGAVDVLRVAVRSLTGVANVTGEIIPLRTAEMAGTSIIKYFGSGPCEQGRGLVADTVVSAASLPSPLSGNGVALLHRNAAFDDYSMLLSTLKQQGVPLDNATARAVDMLGSRVTAMALVGSESTVINDTVVRVAGAATVFLDVITVSEQLPLAPGQVASASSDPVLARLAAVAEASACSLVSPTACAARFNATAVMWAGLWNRSFVTVTAPAGSLDADKASNLTARYVWQRFLSLAGGRRALTPLKFNGMLWSVPTSEGSRSPDFRTWGGDFWSQNSRQAVHEALASADDDVIEAFWTMNRRAVPVAEARERAYWPGSTSGYFFPETMMMFGTYDQGGVGWGCGWTPPAGIPWPVPSNPYIRYYYSGTLEYALLALDAADWASNATIASDWAVPLADAATAHYFNLYNASAPGGALDMFPAQSMETWQCKTLPAERKDCITDPITAVSGLRAVLTRLLALPPSATTPAQRAAWTSRLAAVPPMFNATNTRGIDTWLPGRLAPGRTSNSENVATQPVFPYRLTTAAKAAVFGPSSDAARLLGVANGTYAERPFPCNDGWCWDLIVAASLNLTGNATSQLLDRAMAKGAFSGGWPGFAAHYQDYEPSLDQFAWMRTAVHAMLLQPLDDAPGRMVVLPSWDAASLDVDFSLRGPRATTVRLACESGAIASLTVTPATRAADVIVAGCGGNMRTADVIIASLGA